MIQIGCLKKKKKKAKIYILLHPEKYSNPWSPIILLIRITMSTVLYHWLQGTMEYVIQHSYFNTTEYTA